MRFVKMHGLGNDYVYVNAETESALPDPDREPGRVAALARAISDRHRGVGSDGLIIISRSALDSVPIRMRMWNADGSEAEMCGNGLRCVAKLARDEGLIDRGVMRFPVQTQAGVLEVELLTAAPARTESVRADMGEPRFENEHIPTTGPKGERTIDHDLRVNPGGRASGPPSGETVGTSTIAECGQEARPPGVTVRVTCVSMGNPHAVVFVDPKDAARLDWMVTELGPAIETHAFFPERTNVELVEIISPTHARQRTWERGTGETLACGTGACAVAVAGIITGRLTPASDDEPVTIDLEGGPLEITWNRQTNRVQKAGPATRVFEGAWNDNDVAVD